MTHYGQWSDGQILRSNILLRRIQSDFNPQHFTVAELRAEASAKSHSSDLPRPGFVRINVSGNLTVLIERELVEEIGEGVYRLTDQGEQFDFDAWMRAVVYGEQEDDD